MGKVLSKDDFLLLKGLIEINRIKQNELHDIERLALNITGEINRDGLLDFGNITASILDENVYIEDGLAKLGIQIEKTKRFPKKKFKKKEEIIPKKVIAG